VTTWRELRAEAARALAGGGVDEPDVEARRLVEEASGRTAAEWGSASAPPRRAVERLHDMVTRRVQGEPLQYVLGSWSFRGLDLMVDRRVLIPRPETEWVVEVALEEAVRIGMRRARTRRLAEREPRHLVADLGTGSGAIALALEAELPEAQVWATDASDDALAVARANLAGAGATRVRLARGSWFTALPTELRGRLSLVVSNPPYVAESEVGALPDVVARHEPRRALVAGPTGLEALAHIVEAAPSWLAPHGVLVCEIAPHQAAQVVDRARAGGFGGAFVRDDLAGRPRVLVARRGERRSG
jgi:release factor glutamine methyltransferase